MRTVRPLLIASLVLNIFLLGAIGGSVWHWSRARGGLGGWRHAAMRTLPADRAAQLRAALHDTRAASRPVVEEGRAARAEAARLFRADRFDPASVLGALDRARAADVSVRAKLESRVVAFAATLPPDQRRVLADALARGPLREGERRSAPSSSAQGVP